MDKLDPVAAVARLQERQRVQIGVLEALLRGLAGDVAALVANQPAQHPPPASWLLAADPATALDGLEALVIWVRDVYLWYPGASLPSCWMWHPALVEELYCLAQGHREAYKPPTRSIAKALEWHDRFLPGVVKRLAAKPYSDCELSRHLPKADRCSQGPTDAPLADTANRIATQWSDQQQIPEPLPNELTEAKEADRQRDATN